MEDTPNPKRFLDNIYNATNAPDVGHITLRGLLIGVVNLMIGVGVSIAIIAIAYAFLQYTTSAGDPDKISKAGRALIWAVIAAFVSLAAVAIKTGFFGALGAFESVTNI